MNYTTINSVSKNDVFLCRGNDTFWFVVVHNVIEDLWTRSFYLQGNYCCVGIYLINPDEDVTFIGNLDRDVR